MVAVVGGEGWVAFGGRCPQAWRVQVKQCAVDFGVGGRGHGAGALGSELRRGQVAMAGSTSVNGFHSSFVQRDGRVSPSGFWGAEGAGFRGCSSRRLRIRKRVASHEGASVGFTCFGEEGGHNVRAARARAVESLETASPGTNCTLSLSPIQSTSRNLEKQSMS
jgi:hypothetical protein